MQPVTIFRHVAHEGPGYFAEFLDHHDIAHRMVCIDRADRIPVSLDGISGLVFMGGPMSVNDDLPWIAPVLRLIRQAVAAGTPVLGHCLGGQLLAKALGGVVTPNPVQEIGWFPVQVVDNPVARDWLSGLPGEFDVYHWHGETFSLPSNATRILGSVHCTNQAFVIGNSMGLQCHVEMTAPMVRKWARHADRLPPTVTVQTQTQMTTDVDARVAQLHRVADTLYTRWIAGLSTAA